MKPTIVANLSGLSEFNYLRKIARIFEAIYRNGYLADREMDFFICTLMGIRRGYKNPNSKDFFNLYNTHYLGGDSTKTLAQKRSHLGTVRKSLITDGILDYDKNTMTISTKGDWYDLDSLTIVINVEEADK